MQQQQRRSQVIIRGILLALLVFIFVPVVAQDLISLQPTLCIPGDPQQLLTLSPENFEATEPDEFNYLINLRAVIENVNGQLFEVIVRGNNEDNVNTFINGLEVCAEFIGFDEIGAGAEAALDVLNQLQVGGLIYSSLEQAANLETGSLLGNNTFRGLRSLLEARGVAPEDVNAVIDAGSEIAIGTLQQIGSSLEGQYSDIDVASLVDERVNQISTTLEAAKTDVSVEEYFGEALAARLGFDPDELYPQIEGVDINAFLSSVTSEAPEVIVNDVVTIINERIAIGVQAGWLSSELEAELIEDLEAMLEGISLAEPFDYIPESEVAFDIRSLRDEGIVGILATTACEDLDFNESQPYGPKANFEFARVEVRSGKVRFKTWNHTWNLLSATSNIKVGKSATHGGFNTPLLSFRSKVTGKSPHKLSEYCMYGSYVE